MWSDARRKTWPGLVALAALLLGTGCYHAVVETGRPQSGTTIEKPWAHGFLYGLVPPDPIETASECPSGVARVETKHSFLNGVASAVTFGLYTPITIEVFCAASDAPDRAPTLTYRKGQPPDARLSSALRSSEPFYIRVDAR